MEAFLVGVITYAIGFWYGKRVGMTQMMLRMQRLIYELQEIQLMWQSKTKQWNEDEL